MLVYGKYECFVMHMLYVCMHPVAVFNAAFCMTFRLLMLVEDARGEHMMMYVAMGSAMLLILKSTLLLYSAESGVNRAQVVLSGFSVILFYFVQACRYGCMYFMAALVLVCVDVIVMSSA